MKSLSKAQLRKILKSPENVFTLPVRQESRVVLRGWLRTGEVDFSDPSFGCSMDYQFDQYEAENGPIGATFKGRK